MRQDRNNRGLAMILSTLVVAPLLSVGAQAGTGADLSGQWVGSSRLDGEKSAAKTSLSLGAADADNSILRIEGDTTCTLKQGSYSAGTSGAWSLSFKQAMGGDVCARLAKGAFTLRPAATSHALELEVSYPGPKGDQSLRRGFLSHYP